MRKSGKNIWTYWLFTLLAVLLFWECRPKQDYILIKVGHSHGKSHSYTQALELFGELLDKESQGRYKVKVYYSSQLGSEKEMQEMLTIGSLEMAITGLLNAYEPLFSVFELPYLYDDRQHVIEVMNSTIVDDISHPLHKSGLRIIGFYENGFRHITNSKKPINHPDDLKGMMIRVPENPAQINTFKALQAIPTPLSYSELYTALVQGVVDGQENPLQNIWYGRLFEAQDHIAMTGHIYNLGYLMVSEKFFKELDKEDKLMIRNCLKRSTEWQLQYMEDSEKSLIENLKKEGIAFTYPDKELFRKATYPAYEILYNELGPKAKEIVKDIRSIREKKKVFYINSYHKGYAPSDDIMRGIFGVLDDEDVHLETFFMDTKRNNSPAYTEKVVKEALQKIKTFAPDLIIVSDDNAVKDIIVPHFKNGPIPVVYCGVNWSAESYGLPAKILTGMLEVLPLSEMMDTLRNYYPSARKLAILSENTISEIKNKEILDTLFRSKGYQRQYKLVDDFADWKRAFIKANQEADIIYLPTNGAISGWNNVEAENFVKEHMIKPVVTCDDFMMQFCALGFTKIAYEQGEWAALKGLEILRGKPPEEIPAEKNKRYDIWINEYLAQRIGLNPGTELLNISKKYSQIKN
jgi:TRAP-type transport system periplasmic protein